MDPRKIYFLKEEWKKKTELCSKAGFGGEYLNSVAKALG
jgi:hypothetical protein